MKTTAALILGVLLFSPAFACDPHDKLCRADQLKNQTLTQAGRTLLNAKPDDFKDRLWLQLTGDLARQGATLITNQEGTLLTLNQTSFYRGIDGTRFQCWMNSTETVMDCLNWETDQRQFAVKQNGNWKTIP